MANSEGGATVPDSGIFVLQGGFEIPDIITKSRSLEGSGRKAA
jgi:hypothetical protein